MADHHEPETRRLIRVMPEDVEQTAAVFDLLLGGTTSQGRKDHIAENGYKYLEMAGYFVRVL